MKNGKSGFQALQAALGEGGRRDRIVAYTFDLLHLDGKDLTRLKLTERKDKLQNLLKKSKPGSSLRFSDHFSENGAEMLAKACGLGLGGIICKRADAPYTAGRDKNWLKAKCQQRQEFIIIGYSNSKSGGRALGALYLGYNRNGALTYAGKVGTGFTMKSALALTDKLESHHRRQTGAEPHGDESSGRWRVSFRFTGSSRSCCAKSPSPNGPKTAISAIPPSRA